LVGLAIATVLAGAVYFGGRTLPMKAFFRVTGAVLIVFAAGLASRTVLYLQMSGDLGSINANGVYDLTGHSWLTQSTEIGKFLAAMFGWDPRPSIEQVVVYFGYLVPVLYLFLREPAQTTARPAGREVRSTAGAAS
jgi:high-affinity iron transporter